MSYIDGTIIHQAFVPFICQKKLFYQAQLEIQAQHVSEHNGYHYVYHIRSVKQNTLFIFEFGFV